jgi:hypothetical protein
MRLLREYRVLVLLSLLGAMPVAAQRTPSLMAEHGSMPTASPMAFELLKAQGELIQEAESMYRASVVATLPGFSQAVREVERRTRLSWKGLPPVILVVPDGGRGFACDSREDTCLGRYEGVTLLLQQGADSGQTTMVSLILVAESARARPDVWVHELTHAVLSQHGLAAESQRHDRRYFAEERFVRTEF